MEAQITGHIVRSVNVEGDLMRYVGAKVFCENLLFPNTAHQLIKIALLGTLLYECTGTIGGQHSPNGCSCCCMCGKAETAAATGWVGQVCIQMWADVT